jgi:hypothetical protein
MFSASLLQVKQINQEETGHHRNRPRHWEGHLTTSMERVAAMILLRTHHKKALSLLWHNLNRARHHSKAPHGVALALTTSNLRLPAWLHEHQRPKQTAIIRMELQDHRQHLVQDWEISGPRFRALLLSQQILKVRCLLCDQERRQVPKDQQTLQHRHKTLISGTL